MFLGEIGGNMGLFLGCSLLTIFEFIDVIIRIATRRGRQVLHTQWRHTGAEASVKPTDAILNAYIFSSTEVKLSFKQRKLYQTSSENFFCGYILILHLFFAYKLTFRTNIPKGRKKIYLETTVMHGLPSCLSQDVGKKRL